jgi:hypothetical protein
MMRSFLPPDSHENNRSLCITRWTWYTTTSNAIGRTLKDSMLNTCWGNDINSILSCNTSGEHLWTEAEYQAVLAKEQTN